ncbi:MAG: DEAD/DEAH box helicase, partial [Thermosynechococcaceae cyanobacterium]
DSTGECSPQDALYPELVQVIAILNLLLDGWCEPPIVGQLHLSTLIQQLLSLIVQYGGIRAESAWHILCRTGPFTAVNPTMFAQLLRCLGQHDLIQQSGDGSLLLAPAGDRLVGHYSFYSAFATAQEYRILHQGQAIGNLPTQMPLVPGMQIIFGGQCWRLLSVDTTQRVVEVGPAATGTLPQFSGSIGQVHDRVRQTMRHLYTKKDIPAYLDSAARECLSEARRHFAELGLDRTALLEQGDRTLLFCWQGDRVLNTLLVQLLAKNLKVSRDAVAIAVERVSPQKLMEHLGELVEEGPADAVALAATVANKRIEKHDQFLSDELMCMNYAASCLDPQNAWKTLKNIA